MEAEEKKTFTDHLKSDLEELEVQLKLGGMELKKSYGTQKERFAGLVRKFHEYVNEIEHEGAEKVSGFKEKSRDLLDVLETDFDISYTDYSDKPQDVKAALLAFEESLKDLYNQLDEKTVSRRKKLETELRLGLDKFRNELAIQQKHLEHQKAKSMDEFDKWKENRLEEVQNLKKRIDERFKETGGKIDKLNEDLGEAYDHLKKAFRNFRS